MLGEKELDKISSQVLIFQITKVPPRAMCTEMFNYTNWCAFLFFEAIFLDLGKSRNLNESFEIFFFRIRKFAEKC